MISDCDDDINIPNLYEILGLDISVCDDADCDKIIHKAYIKKARECHPDKNGFDPEKNELFALLSNTYDVLKSKSKRNKYNKKILRDVENVTSDNFFDLKKKFTEAEKHPLNTDIVLDPQTDFNNKMNGFDFNDKMNGFDFNNKIDIEQLIDARSKQESEFKPEKIFDNKNMTGIDLERFNALFNKHNNKNNLDMTEYKMPNAWDTASSLLYGSFDGGTNDGINDGINDETNDESNDGINGKYYRYSSDYNKQTITRNDLDNISLHNDSDDVTPRHNIRSSLINRKNDTIEINKMKPRDFNAHDFGVYGISDKIGFVPTKIRDCDIDVESILKPILKLNFKPNPFQNQ